MKDGIWEDHEFMVDETLHAIKYEREQRLATIKRPVSIDYGSRDGLRMPEYIDALEAYADALETALGVIR